MATISDDALLLAFQRARRPGADAGDRLAWSVDFLRVTRPEESAYRTFSRRQRRGLLVLLVLLAGGLVLALRPVVVALLASVIALYLLAAAFRLFLAVLSSTADVDIDLSAATVAELAEYDLPRYTVLVPAYREPHVLPTLVAAIDRIDYPRDRLEVLVIVESDDLETMDAARHLTDPYRHMRVVAVPACAPRTKPKALNYALLDASGDVVTVYDAEDVPDRGQLRWAAAALAANPRLGCVQARLNYFNGEQNLLTRWFALEYAMWFEQFLPGLVQLRVPVPLGGTSNHFRRELLLDLGGWDPYNVTEDADLGLRIHRSGHEVGVLPSVTLEEANSDVVNWLKQRSRWYKGYLQTWLVNLRHPRAAVRVFGWRGFLLMNLFVGGTPLLAVLNPVFWSLTLAWFVLRPAFVEAVFPGPVLYGGLIAWVIGNLLLVYAFVVVAADRPGRYLGPALATPLYFVLMSVAAWKALVQLVVQPSFWEKTTHGLLPDLPERAGSAP